MPNSLLARRLDGTDAVDKRLHQHMSCGETHARRFRLLLGSVKALSVVLFIVGVVYSGTSAEEVSYFPCKDEDVGSNPTRSTTFYGAVAQR